MKRTKQQALNRYSGPRKECAWPNCDKQGDDFPNERIGVLCLHHAWSVAQAVNEMTMRDMSYFEAKAVLNKMTEAQVEADKREQLRQQRGKQPGWVYYLRVGDRVKIGYSVDVKRRMRAYPPESQLLAVHPGTPNLETDMHRRFAGSRAAGREWFRETVDLTEHIAEVVEQFGEPTAHRYNFRTAGTPMKYARPAA